MTALSIAAAVIVMAAGAIVQFRTAAVTTESAGGGADADVFSWPGSPPVDGRDPVAAGAPSPTGPAAPFQIRPAAVQADSDEDDRPASTSGQSAGPDQVTPVTPSPVSPAPSASAVPTDTATEPAERPLRSADLPAQPAVVIAVEAPPQGPAAPAPVATAGTPPPQAPAPDPAPAPQPTASAPAPQPTAAPPPTAPETAPTRGNSAAHRPEHANGGVGNTERPTPADPGSAPND